MFWAFLVFRAMSRLFAILLFEYRNRVERMGLFCWDFGNVPLWTTSWCVRKQQVSTVSCSFRACFVGFLLGFRKPILSISYSILYDCQFRAFSCKGLIAGLWQRNIRGQVPDKRVPKSDLWFSDRLAVCECLLAFLLECQGWSFVLSDSMSTWLLCRNWQVGFCHYTLAVRHSILLLGAIVASALSLSYSFLWFVSLVGLSFGSNPKLFLAQLSFEWYYLWSCSWRASLGWWRFLLFGMPLLLHFRSWAGRSVLPPCWLLSWILRWCIFPSLFVVLFLLLIWHIGVRRSRARLSDLVCWQCARLSSKVWSLLEFVLEL